MRKLILGLAIIVGFALQAACSSVSSRSVDYASGKSQVGMHYSVPKGLFAVDLVKSGSQLSVNISEPFYEGDPNATFIMKASGGAFADQQFRFRVHPATRLLWTVRSDSLGRFDDFLVNAAKSAAGVQASDESEYLREAVFQRLYHRIIDPMMQDGCDFGKSCKLTNVMAELTAAAAPHIDCSEKTNAAFCETLQKGESLFTIQLDPLFELDSSNRPSAKSRKCSDSICYRTPLPYELRLEMKGVTNIAQIVYLPNKGPIMGMNLPAGFFADSKSRVVMIDGMPVLHAADKESEIAVAAGVPLRVVNSFFKSAAEVVKLRVDYKSEQANLEDAEVKRLKAQEKREQAEEERVQDDISYDISADESEDANFDIGGDGAN